MAFIYPDLEWYTKISEQEKIPLRCPYSNVHRCPRYYASIHGLGEHGVTTKIKEDKVKELDELWNKSDILPVIAEHDTGISSSNDKISSYSNFCPEVTYDIFNLFAILLIYYSDDSVQEAAYAEMEKDAYPKDWRLHWAHVEPLHYCKCPVYSQLITRPVEKNTETLNDQVIVMKNDTSIVRKTETAFDDLIDLWKRRKIVCLLVLLVIIIPIGFSAYQKYKVIPDLELVVKENNSKISILENDIQSAKQAKDKAELQLAPFLAVANHGFPDVPPDKRLDLLLTKMDQVIEAVEDTALKIIAERILPKNIITEMSNKLRNLPQLNVEISCNIGDNEGYTLAKQVKSIFNNAEWKISGVFQSAFVPPAKHILLEFGSQPPKELRKALLPLFDRFGYAREAIIKSNLPDNRLNIIVGSK